MSRTCCLISAFWFTLAFWLLWVNRIIGIEEETPGSGVFCSTCKTETIPGLSCQEHFHTLILDRVPYEMAECQEALGGAKLGVSGAAGELKVCAFGLLLFDLRVALSGDI